MALKRRGNFKQRVGKCYQLSANFVLEHRGFILIHGTLRSPFLATLNTEIDHAWCESVKVIYDPVLDRRFKRDDFDAIFQPVRLFRYEWRQVMNKLCDEENYGPWDYIPTAVIAKRKRVA